MAAKKKKKSQKAKVAVRKDDKPESAGLETFKDYWEIIEMPFYVLIVWNILGIILQVYVKASRPLVPWVGWVIMIGVFSYIAHQVVQRGGRPGQSVRAGAICGAVSGFVGSVIALVSYYAFPMLYAESMQAAIEAGAPQATVEQFTQIGLYVNLVFGPIISAIIGLVIAVIAHMVISRS